MRVARSWPSRRLLQTQTTGFRSSESPWRVTWRRLRANTIGILACGIVTLIFASALLAPWVAPYDPLALNTDNRLASPSLEHLLGTDDLGRDLFSRMLWGARISLRLAAVVVAFAVTIGIVVGIIAGYSGGMRDRFIMRSTDVFLAFPDLILAMAFSATLGPSVLNAAIALGLVWWPGYARLVRGQVLAVKHREFIEASRSVGAPPLRLLLRHILPNCLSPVMVRVTMTAGYAILAGASLSFVGLGAQPPTPEWGLMVAVARQFFLTAWWYPTLVGICILITVLAFTVAGDAVRDALDVHARDI